MFFLRIKPSVSLCSSNEVCWVQGYLTYKKTHPPRSLLQAYAWGPRVIPGGWASSYGRGTPVPIAKCGVLQTEIQRARPHEPQQGYLAHKKQRTPRNLQ
jgi:hypothetical protein